MEEHVKQLLLLGREHYEKRDYEKAEAVLREVLFSNDRLADVHNMLGVICHQRGNFVQAEHHFERAMSLNPNYTEAALNLAVTYNDRGKYEAARQIYMRIKGTPSGSIQALDPFARGKLANMHAEVGQAYADAGLSREAIVEFEKAVLLCPDFVDLRTRLGALLREVSELGKAREQYEAALAARPTFVPARIQLGVTLLAMGETRLAEWEWKKVLEIEPDNPTARMYLRVLTGAGSTPPAN